jgi:peptidoglycan hydrolase-like protein with peptidoglycan-binding domain
VTWALPGRGGTETIMHSVIEPGDKGIQVWAVQTALNEIGRTNPILADGSYGDVTKRAVATFQTAVSGLEPDGVTGPLTQRKMIGILVDSREDVWSGPDGLLRSTASYEGGWLVAPMNWSSPNGVDCGCIQRRLMEASFGDDAAIQRAFDSRYQIRLLAVSVENLRDLFYGRPGARGNNELAYRLAVLNHNYPYAADRISRVGINGLSIYFRTPQTWVTKTGIRFTDGTPIKTPLEWCQRYALGNPAHKEPGQAVKLVTSW